MSRPAPGGTAHGPRGRADRAPSGLSRPVGLVAAVVSGSWPFALMQLTGDARFWVPDKQLGGLPLLLLASGFTGSFVYRALGRSRVSWAEGVICGPMLSLVNLVYWLLADVLAKTGVQLLLGWGVFLVLCSIGALAGSAVAGASIPRNDDGQADSGARPTRVHVAWLAAWVVTLIAAAFEIVVAVIR
jgi:hypothetical protein